MSEVAKEDLTDLQSRFMCFTLSAEKFAIPLLAVREVIAMPELTPVPFTPPHFLGIMNLRGQIISVMDLRKKFKMPSEIGEETAVIICDIGGTNIGIVVDSVDMVLSQDDVDLSEKPETFRGKDSEYVAGVMSYKDKLIVLMDIAKTLDLKDLEAIKKAK